MQQVMVKNDFVLTLLTSCLLLHIRSTAQGPTDPRGTASYQRQMATLGAGSGSYGHRRLLQGDFRLASIHWRSVPRWSPEKSYNFPQIDTSSRLLISASYHEHRRRRRSFKPEFPRPDGKKSVGSLLPALWKKKSVWKRSTPDLAKLESKRSHDSTRYYNSRSAFSSSMFMSTMNVLQKLRTSYPQKRSTTNPQRNNAFEKEEGVYQRLSLTDDFRTKTFASYERNLTGPNRVSNQKLNISQRLLGQVSALDLHGLNRTRSSVVQFYGAFEKKTGLFPPRHSRNRVSGSGVKLKVKVKRDTALITVSVWSIMPILHFFCLPDWPWASYVKIKSTRSRALSRRRL